MTVLRLIFTFLLIPLLFVDVHCAKLIEVFQWKQIDYHNRGSGSYRNKDDRASSSMYNNGDRVIFPDAKWRQRREVLTSRHDPVGVSVRANFANTANSSDSYIPYNNVPMGATYFDGRLYVTVPRRRVGIPSTLNYIPLSKESKKRSPKLHAYPDFNTNALNANTVSDPNHLLSVYRTTVDECKRLWFIDTGMLEYPNNFTQAKRPTIWIIDLTTHEVVRRFQIPESIVSTGRGLASITIEVNANNCTGAFAYLPDLVNNQLYVYSFNQNRMWSFSHNYFNFDPLGGDLSIGGQNFRWNDGIFSTTLGPINENGYHDLYFHAMASTNEFKVSTEVLQNESNAARSDHGNDFQLLGSRGPRRQSTMHAYDKNTGVIFYDEIQNNGVGCWNTHSTFNADNHGIVDQNEQRMIYPSDLTIDDESTLWVMTNSMPVFIYSELDPNEINFRVWKQTTETAIKDTICEEILMK